MRRLKLYILLLLAVLLQAAWFDYIKIFGAKPDLALIVVIFVGLFGGVNSGFSAGFFAGFLIDIFQITPFGTAAFSYSLAGILSGIFGKRFYRESSLTQIIFTAIFTVFTYSIFYLSKINLTRLNIYDYDKPFFTIFLLTSVIYNSLSAPFVFRASYKIFNLKIDNSNRHTAKTLPLRSGIPPYIAKSEA